MQKLLTGSLLYILILLSACNGKQSDQQSADPAQVPAQGQTASEGSKKPAPETEYPKSEAPVAEVEKVEITLEMVTPFLPKGHELLDWKAGDLNRDAFEDVVLIAKSQDEPEAGEYSEDHFPRPLILLLGSADQGMVQAERNDQVVLCSSCGGVFGDPFEGITIKDGYFSLEHYGGSNWRWSRIITFKYDEAKKNWYLHKDGGESYNTGDPEGTKEVTISTTKDFGIVKFADFKAE